MEKDSVSLLRPGDAHSVISQSEDVRVLGLSVRIAEVEKVYYMYGSDFCRNKPDGDSAVFFSCPDIYTKLCALYGQIGYMNTEHNCKFFLSYLVKAHLDTLHPQSALMPLWLSAALKEMEKPENIKEGISALIRISNYSQSRLSKLMKQYLNTSLHDYILNLRLEAAYTDLLLTAKSAEEIGENVGYASFSHFQKIFKQKYGITPAALRKKRTI